MIVIVDEDADQRQKHEPILTIPPRVSPKTDPFAGSTFLRIVALRKHAVTDLTLQRYCLTYNVRNARVKKQPPRLRLVARPMGSVFVRLMRSSTGERRSTAPLKSCRGPPSSSAQSSGRAGKPPPLRRSGRLQ